MSVEFTQTTQKGNNVKLFWKSGNESGCFRFDQTKTSKEEAMRFVESKLIGGSTNEASVVEKNVEKSGGESDDETEPTSASAPKSSRPKIKK